MISIKNIRLNYEENILNNKLDKNEMKYLVGFYREKFNVYNFIDVKNGFIIVNIDFKNNNYPFSSPTVYLENKNGAKINYLKLLNYESNKLKKTINKKDYYYAKLLEIPNKYYQKILNYKYCLCCSSKMCNDNWNTFVKIDDILNEIYKNYQLIQKIKNMIIAKVIMRKHLKIILIVIYDFL